MKTGMRLIKIAVIGALLSGMAATAFASPAGTLPVIRNMPTRLNGATLVQKHSSSAKLSIVVGLRLQNAEQLKTFLSQLRDPGSSNYHRYLKPQQFSQLYGPTQDQVAAVESFLTSNGINIQRVSPNHTLIEASASTATLQRAFGVTINDYKDKDGAFFSASGNPSVPASLNGLVLSVMGLDNAVTLTEHLRAPTEVQATAATTPHLGPGGFSPQQIATAYGWPDLTDTNQAAGTKIAIATAYSFSMKDVSHFWVQYGLPSHTVSQTFYPVGQSTRRLNDETTLDIERSSAMSPGSTILVYSGVSPSLVNFDLVFDAIVNDDMAQVISTSWGSPESGSSSEAQEDQEFEQAFSQGETVLAAAGDNGASDGARGADNADFPSSDPFVVAAGGTHLVLNGDNTINSESAWSGAGGADSKEFAEPPYQSSSSGWTSNTSCSGDTSATFTSGDACSGVGAPGRQSSDISMDADPHTGMSLYYNGRWAVFGGTSFVAPELAGLFAIAVTRNSHIGLGDGARLVFCAGNNNAADFNDITAGSNGSSHVFDAGTGWDHPTGWGTPHSADSLANDFVAAAASCSLMDFPL